MKRMISISLLIFLVMGALVLFAWGPKANAADAFWYAGSWVGSSEMIMNDDQYTDAVYTTETMTVKSDGSGQLEQWSVYDLAKTEWTPSEVVTTDSSYSWGATSAEVSADASYFKMSMSEVDPRTGATVTVSGRCYGMSQTSIGFTEMKCIQIVHTKGGEYELNEKSVRTVDYKRKSLLRQ